MKVKYIIGAVLILALGYEIYRIEKQLSVVTLEIRKTDRATITIPAMTEASTFDNSDLFVVADGGTVTRKMAGSKITGAIHDSAEVLRSQMDTSGGGTFSGDTIEFSDGSRIFGGGGQIDIQPSAAVTPGNKLSFYTGGGGDTIYISSNNKRVIFNTSVMELPGYTSVQDSLYLDYIGAGSITGGVYLLLSPNQAVDTGRTQPASIGMKRPLRPIEEQMSDTVNGEMKWTHFKNGNWVERYGVSNSDPIATDEEHTIAIEEAYRHILELEIRVKYLESLNPENDRITKKETIGLVILILLIFGFMFIIK